ncbi:MAG: hypothetical protein R3284_12665, partial [Rubricoccaceae bacterium]|nr:hypothetical protein [Rubricoccaceae bacterium]
MTDPLSSYKALALVTVLGLALVACDSPNGNGDPGDTPPTLITADAFDYDGESFPDASAAQAQGTNHSRAFLTVLIVNTAVGVHLILPAAATNAAGQDTPHVEDGTWIWERTVTVGNSVVDIRLEGTPSGSMVDWEMFITSDNFGGQAYDDFSLYTATTAIGGG